MSDVCRVCGGLKGSCTHTNFIKFNTACEKLAKKITNDWAHGNESEIEIEEARLWVIENVLKVGWKNNDK